MLFVRLSLGFIFVGQAPAADAADRFDNQIYRAVLDSPGGELPFVLKLERQNDRAKGFILNGSERIELSEVRRDRGRFSLDIKEYESAIEADLLAADFQKGPQAAMSGIWKKRTGGGQWAEMPFRAETYAGYRFKPNLKVTLEIVNSQPVGGRWAVKFSSDDSPAIGVFKEGKDKTVEGTFLTTTGDYRYLAGSYEHGLLRLSCFDGSHAFLFHARMQADGTLQGDFWSGAKWHETWTARRDDKAALPDGFGLTKINPKARLKGLKFPDLEGKERALGEPGLLGKATIVEIFGSWCPNCHDASELLVELEKKYGPRGFKVVGLAFESGDTERDVRQVKHYLERHKAMYPVLLAGVRDREKASAALPVIEKLQSYPTFLFVDADGTVRSVYSGFSGPATGEEHTKLQSQFEGVIEKLLGTGG